VQKGTGRNGELEEKEKHGIKIIKDEKKEKLTV
jgi:hypothetical protein